MKKILAIAHNTFREAVRNKILYSILFFSVFIIMLSILMDTLTIRQDAKIVIDMGLASISLFGTLMAIFIGITLVSSEIDNRTIYTITTKPIKRYYFIIGKYLGLIFILAMNVLIMTFCFVIVVWAATVRSIDIVIFQVIGMIFVELMVITAISVLCSTLTNPTLAGIISMSVFVLGHLSSDLANLIISAKTSIILSIMRIIILIIPDLEMFNIKNAATYTQIVDLSLYRLSLFYAAFYIVILLFLSALIFQRKEFK